MKQGLRPPHGSLGQENVGFLECGACLTQAGLDAALPLRSATPTNS